MLVVDAGDKHSAHRATIARATRVVGKKAICSNRSLPATKPGTNVRDMCVTFPDLSCRFFPGRNAIAAGRNAGAEYFLNQHTHTHTNSIP